MSDGDGEGEGGGTQCAVTNNQSSVDAESEGPARETRVSLPPSKPKGKAARLSRSGVNRAELKGAVG